MLNTLALFVPHSVKLVQVQQITVIFVQEIELTQLFVNALTELGMMVVKLVLLVKTSV